MGPALSAQGELRQLESGELFAYSPEVSDSVVRLVP